MDRKPDWKVFLNMAAARVSGSHVRSETGALPREGASVSSDARRAKCNDKDSPAPLRNG